MCHTFHTATESGSSDWTAVVDCDAILGDFGHQSQQNQTIPNTARFTGGSARTFQPASVAQSLKQHLSVQVLCISRNRITRLPGYLTEFTKLDMLKVDHNPIEWPPKAIIEAAEVVEGR